MTVEEKLKVALQSKSHHFLVGVNFISVEFKKDKCGTISSVKIIKKAGIQ